MRVTSDKLSPPNTGNLSAPIGLNRLSSEVTAKLDQNATIGSGSITKTMLANEVLRELNCTKDNNFIIDSFNKSWVIKATDPDGDKINYSLSGKNADMFEVNQDTGEIKFLDINPLPNFWRST